MTQTYQVLCQHAGSLMMCCLHHHDPLWCRRAWVHDHKRESVAAQGTEFCRVPRRKDQDSPHRLGASLHLAQRMPGLRCLAGIQEHWASDGGEFLSDRCDDESEVIREHVGAAHKNRYDLSPVDITGPTATATSASADARLAVDGDASTRWSSGQAQSAGQNVTTDLGKAKKFSRVAVDSGGNLGDYARTWQLETSTDGSNWTVKATGAGTAQLTNIDVTATKSRYLRISSAGDAGNWWSIADVRLYG